MAIVKSVVSRNGLTIFVTILALSSFSWGTFINLRHSIHLSVNEPDDPRFKLDNMERIANMMIAAKREGRTTPAARENPYATTPRCDHDAVFRTIDGTCNNLNQPWMGAAKTPLIRMSSDTYQDGFNAPRITYYQTESVLPTPRRVSLSIHLTSTNISNTYSHLLMNWGQFTDHDITLSPESGGEGGEEANKTQCCMASPDAFKDNLRECFPISTANDPVYRRTCIPFLRSAPIPGLPHMPVMRYQMNDLTAYIDASMIYANTNLKARALRSLKGGKLKSTKIRNEERLPDEANNPENCFRGEQECRFASGDVRNSEQAGLTSLHTLMLRHHNKLAERLKRHNPHWDDELLYQTARKIIGAIVQRITYNEFLPLVIGPRYMRKYGLELLDLGRFKRYSPTEECAVMTEFSTAAFRFGHSLIRQTFSHDRRPFDVKDIFDAYKTTDRFGTDGLLRGAITDRIESGDQFIIRGVRDNLFGEEMDLPSFNIQRGRDHAIGSYHDVRRAMRMRIHRDWDSMAGTSHRFTTVNDMKKVYPDPEDIELFPGGMSEKAVEGGVVGDTFAEIIGMQFKKFRYGDRFWHETPNRKIGFTDGQLAEVRKATLAMLFCENVAGVRARKWLLLSENRNNNPAIDCRDIPIMDINVWKEGFVPLPPQIRARPVLEPTLPLAPTSHNWMLEAFRNQPTTKRMNLRPRYRPTRPHHRPTIRPYSYQPRRPRTTRQPRPRHYTQIAYPFSMFDRRNDNINGRDSQNMFSPIY